jgi:hypothetical protein
MPIHNERLTSGSIVAGPDISGSPPLLEQLLDHAQRNTITGRYRLSGPFMVIIGNQNPFT